MENRTTNFMSYNSTGLDYVKTNWIRTIIDTCKIDFFQLQEHFKATKSLVSDGFLLVSVLVPVIIPSLKVTKIIVSHCSALPTYPGKLSQKLDWDRVKSLLHAF